MSDIEDFDNTWREESEEHPDQEIEGTYFPFIFSTFLSIPYTSVSTHTLNTSY